MATSCDDRYLWPWACTVFSAVRGARVPVRFLLANADGLLSPQASELARELLVTLGVDGDVLDVSLDVAELRKYQWNATIYARLALADLLDETFLWLDSDTVLCADWTGIFEEGDRLFEDPGVVACSVRDRLATLESLREAGTNSAYAAAADQYVNTGVILIDPIRWRQNGLDREWRPVAATQSQRGFDFPDQDILNLLLAGKIGLLPSGFNHIVSEPTDGTEHILHFAGYPKPWRLTESGRALYIALEATNFDRPLQSISQGGDAWQLFPRYWEVERALMTTLEDGGHTTLARELQVYREAQLTTLSPQLRMKLWGMRFLSRWLLPRRLVFRRPG